VHLFGSTLETYLRGYNLNEGLLAYYKFNGNFGDSSGNSLHALAFGNPSFGIDKDGKNNGALDFDGGDDFLTVNDNGILSVPSITISLWFKTTLMGPPQELLSRHFYGNATNFSWVTAISNINNYMDFAAVPPYQCGTVPPLTLPDVLFSNQTASLNQWYHLVCTFGDGMQKIYVNGTLRNYVKRPFPALPVCSPSQLIIGAWWASDQALFKGSMDEVRIYNRVLNDQEIEELSVIK
jgi:hypothetical protein